MARLAGKTAIITGATGGIGEAAARRFLAEGANLVLVARNAEKLHALQGELDGGDRVVLSPGDIASETDTKKFVANAVDAFGGLDILFANAGTEGVVKPILEFTVEEFDAVQTTNVRGTWLSIKHAAPAMLESGGGSIIVTSSVVGSIGVPGIGAYAASKHALMGLMKVTALELAEHGVRCNVVAPAPVDNAMMDKLHQMAAPGAPEAAEEGFKSLVPMKRYGSNEEVANMVLFLASDESAFCTGSVYGVDGGFLAC